MGTSAALLQGIIFVAALPIPKGIWS